MRKNDPQINLRVPPDLKERIQEAAKLNRRTQTAEILARLQESFDVAHPGASEEEAALMRARARLDQTQAEMSHAMREYQYRLAEIDRLRNGGKGES